MRTLTFFTLFFASIAAHSQFSLSVNGGWNNTTTHVVNTENNYNRYVARPGWQGAVGMEYEFKHSPWVLYSGLDMAKENIYNQTSSYQNQYIKYAPTFLMLPLGAGYEYTFTKKFGMRFYAGLYGSLGTGGKYISRQGMACFSWECPETFNVTNRQISFGNNSTANAPDDLARSNWGTQFGLGIKTWQRFELECMYNLGLSNISPADKDENLQLRSVSLNLKVNLITFVKSAQK